MTQTKVILAIGAVALIGIGTAYAQGLVRTPVAFFKGHWHDEQGTHDAPQHSGGLDRNGCHNGSVPYHCH